MNDFPVWLQIELLRGDTADLSAAMRQLRWCGLDSASAQLLLGWKRTELEGCLDSLRRCFAARPGKLDPGTGRRLPTGGARAVVPRRGRDVSDRV
jgi:hypothetical protein